MIRRSMPILARTSPQRHQPAEQGPDHLQPHAAGVATGCRRAATNAFLASWLLTLAGGVTGGQANDASHVARSPSGHGAVLPAELQTTEVRSAFGMVAAGSPEAARAGALMLEQGGNAVDAAVAAAFAIGVVNPLDAGLGGQAYALIHLNDGRDVAIDGSAPVPLRVIPDELKVLTESGFPYGYKFVCTPGTPAALAYALQRYGTKSLAQVLAPAIELADFGYIMMPHIEHIVAKYAGIMAENEVVASYLLKDGLTPWPAGRLCSPRR
jgi:gamma-glutamyltranspeptidase